MAKFKLKGYSGAETVYDADQVLFNPVEGDAKVPFSYGEAIDNVPITLDFSAGVDQRVISPDGYLVKSAVIQKPADLVAENVKRGKVIAGVEGDFVGDTEEITVDGDNDLTFAGGESFVVEPSSAEKVISKVTISPPSALVPENIAKGVTVAGVEGTHEGGGGGGSAELNIAFGDAAPSDTSKLWIQGVAPSDLLVSSMPFSIEPNTIEKLGAALPMAWKKIRSVIIGKKIYLFGGYAPSLTDRIAVFDSESETVEMLSTTLPSIYVEVVPKDNKVYLFGVNPDNVNEPGGGIAIFDTDTGTIEMLSTTFPYRYRSMSTAAVGKKIYLFGGFYNGYTGSASDMGFLNTIYVFDTDSGTLETISATLPTKAYEIIAVTFGEKIYLLGGYTGTSYLRTINVFDTTNNTLKTLTTSLPVDAFGYNNAVVGTKIYLFGSSVSINLFNTIYVFDMETETIELLSTTLPDRLSETSAAAIDGKIYLFGGNINTSSTVSDAIWKFTALSSLDTGTVRVVTTGKRNLFRLFPNLETYISRVYRGNAENIPEQNEAFVFKDGEWTNIIPVLKCTWSVEAVSGATYGFALAGDYYVSQNKGVNSSYAICKVVINANVDCTAVFNCINYAESSYDYGLLSTIDATLTSSSSADSLNLYKSFKGLSKSTVQPVEYEMPAGEHFVYVKFIKDSSGNSNNDTLQFNVTFKE